MGPQPAGSSGSGRGADQEAPASVLIEIPVAPLAIHRWLSMKLNVPSAVMPRGADQLCPPSAVRETYVPIGRKQLIVVLELEAGDGHATAEEELTATSTMPSCWLKKTGRSMLMRDPGMATPAAGRFSSPQVWPPSLVT